MWGAAYAYFALLALVVALVATRHWNRSFIAMVGVPMVRTIMAILANSVLANAWTVAHGGGEPWALFFALDFVCALVVLRSPAGRIQSVVGTTFLIKLALDTAYGLTVSYGHPDPTKYWWALTVVGLLQLLLVGGWWASERFPYNRGVRWLHKIDNPAHSPGLG